MRVRNLDILGDSSATMLSQIEGWRDKASRRYKAQLISEDELVSFMRRLDRLEDTYESAELSLIGLCEEAKLENNWIGKGYVKYNWPIKQNPRGSGAGYAK